ncbi:aimless RasGEF (aleA) [Metarhizium album ARSEF 1941]|uniref:Aimless RasGEF (AleA) n=1 Tax=Metarhizium album (strain ARSEF 1941) TaxID=1081103 RepID=A0A0B2WIK3_METAS|nr:aimless RasGEF (aleA) [Metarhizium album ARSEF 1941]KHN95861.1 aimless RasGEF (aleA) [Metarhizium album ARSEF 1941]
MTSKGSNTSSSRKNRRTSDGSASLPKRSSGATVTSQSTTTTTTTNNTGHNGKRRQSKTTARDSIQTNASSSVFSRSSNSTGLTAASTSPSALSLLDTVGASDRDSFVSIVDDPFFQRFDPANATYAEREASDEGTSAEPHDNSDDNNKTQPWPPPRRESLTIGPSHYWVRIDPAPSSILPHSSSLLPLKPPAQPPTTGDTGPHHPISAMDSYNIAIIGADAVGKSTFVQRVLHLSRPPVTNTSSARQVVDSVTHMVTLVELDLEHFELNPSQPMQWPKQINGHIVPRMDAALILYDVTKEQSIRQLPQTVAALTNSGLPAMLGACKCDSPEDDWEVNADELANFRLFKACLGQYKISMDRPDISQACLQALLRAAVAHRRDETSETVLRRRAQSTANLEAPDPSAGRPLSEHSKHSRASSDFSILRTSPNQQSGENYRAQASRSPRPGLGIDKSGTESFLEIDESDSESRRCSDDIPILQRNDDVIIEKQPKITGVTFEELVDRLLAPRLSRVDNNFSDIFLCLYRKFAAPGELFSAILVRLEKARDDKTTVYLTKTATQLRIIEVVAKWVSLYPGDFARSTTRRNLEDFIKHLSTEPVFAIAAQQMRRNLYVNVIEDDDTGWANSDNSSDEIASKILSKDINEVSVGVNALQLNGESDRLRSPEKLSTDKGSRAGIQFQFNSCEEYEREATLLEPSDHLPMNKFRYHIFMDISDDDFADELTRIDWIMFSSIRIRDFVRHVSLSAAQKDKCRSLQNMNRMISHFNHIAKWVANMILLRDKAKHRAQMLEKFMNIALKLRQLNNYNGLAAVLAGINGTAIHRLAQTRTLVPTDVQKRFARLVILMGTQKSHFAYRLAWENSPLPRIPFIPLHRRDLVSAEEGSKTFVGLNEDRINWKKFEVLGEVLLPIMKSQGTAYPNLAKDETARDLILGCRMPTDDEVSV